MNIMAEQPDCAGCKETDCSAKTKQPDESAKEFIERQELASRMCRIRHKIIVLSGKGGVGKSTVAVNLAAALAMKGKSVGLLDVDVHGPSVPKLLRLEKARATASEGSLNPVPVFAGLRAMSIGFLMPDSDDAVIWRGPRKYGLIKQFLRDVAWGNLDFLVVDSPPGTGDEPLAVVQLISDPDGAIVVTTPQDLAVQDVRRSIRFCRELGLPVLGVIENMSGLVCPKCGERIHVFGSGGGRAMAEDMDVDFLGAIPMNPDVVASGDDGRPFVQIHSGSETEKAFAGVVLKILGAS
jgi:Mrp family chromosome partitioning ATPase